MQRPGETAFGAEGTANAKSQRWGPSPWAPGRRCSWSRVDQGRAGNELSKVAKTGWYCTSSATLKTLGFILRDMKPSEGSDQRRTGIWFLFER